MRKLCTVGLAVILLLWCVIPVSAVTDTTDTTQVTDQTTAFGDTAVPSQPSEPTAPTAPAEPAPPPVESHILVDHNGVTADGVSYLLERSYVSPQEYPTADGRQGGRAAALRNGAYIEAPLPHTDGTPFTLSMWVNWQEEKGALTAEDQRLFTVFEKESRNMLYFNPLVKVETDDGFINGMRMTATTLQGTARVTNQLSYVTGQAVSGGMPHREWHHIALAVSGDEMTVYLDGMRWHSGKMGFAFVDLKADTLLLGAGPDGVNAWNGLMQNVVWYDAALTHVQIARLAKDLDAFDQTQDVETPVYTPVEIPTDLVAEKGYTAWTENGKTAISTRDGVAFWEQPMLGAGQSVQGELSLANRSKHLLDVAWDTLALPQKNTPAWQYLSQLQVDIRKGDETLFSGAYTDLPQALEKLTLTNMPYRRTQTYTLFISRDFLAQGAAVAVDIPWTFSCTLADVSKGGNGRRVIWWLLILLPLSALLVGMSVYCHVVKKDRRVFTVWNGVAANIKVFWDTKCVPILDKIKVQKNDLE